MGLSSWHQLPASAEGCYYDHLQSVELRMHCHIWKHIRGMFQLYYWKTYEVTGMSPQSNTVAQLSKGFASRGTL